MLPMDHTEGNPGHVVFVGNIVTRRNVAVARTMVPGDRKRATCLPRARCSLPSIVHRGVHAPKED